MSHPVDPARVPEGSVPLPRDLGGRAARWARLVRKEFDLLIVGGGITGAGLASLASERGWKVALVEREDFGSGTSGATSKMLHGGLRYLQQRDTRLVREALHERGLLLRRFGPRRVQLTPFLLPLEGSAAERWKLRFGTWLYQRMSGKLSLGPRKVLTAAEVREKAPLLRSEGVRGGVLYFEGVIDDVLLTVTRVGEATQRGAVALNHVEVTTPVLDDGKIRGVEVRDTVTQATGRVSARVVVNAAGVWSGAWAGAGRTPALRPSKGVHLVFRRASLPLEVAVVLATPDDRWVFALPYGPLTIVGTTDTDYDGDRSKVHAEAEDVNYLLSVASKNFPTARLSIDEVVDVYAGLRPLLAGDAARPGDLSREDVVHQDASGLLTLVGGKLTTHRAMAERALELVAPALPPPPREPKGRARGAETSNGGWSSWAFPPAWEGVPCPGAAAVEAALERGVPGAGSAPLGDWVRGAIEVTGAWTLTDLIDRRFHALDRLDARFPALVSEVAAQAGALLGWSPEERSRQQGAYLEHLHFQTQAVEELRQQGRRSPGAPPAGPAGSRPPR